MIAATVNKTFWISIHAPSSNCLSFSQSIQIEEPSRFLQNASEPYFGLISKKIANLFNLYNRDESIAMRHDTKPTANHKKRVHIWLVPLNSGLPGPAAKPLSGSRFPCHPAPQTPLPSKRSGSSCVSQSLASVIRFSDSLEAPSTPSSYPAVRTISDRLSNLFLCENAVPIEEYVSSAFRPFENISPPR